ncbi:MAG TPA: HD domain-containing protein [Bacteroidales bacterium]|nr:HD domain-containing protein [Bacteroidales bacterium]
MLLTTSDFDIKPGYFIHESVLHGKLHTYRVMCNVLVLEKRLNLGHDASLAFFAAFVHDMARRHDGFCLMHGPRAARIKVPEFRPLFEKYGLTNDDIGAISTAVSNHSQYVEVSRKHPHYMVAALLKDADALDRARLGNDNLNPKYLRLSATSGLISFASQLFELSNGKNHLDFAGMLDIACGLSEGGLLEQ